MFELLLLAAGAAAATPNDVPPAEPPSLELLEFLGDWSEDEARALDQTAVEAAEDPDRKTRHEPQDR